MVYDLSIDNAVDIYFFFLAVVLVVVFFEPDDCFLVVLVVAFVVVLVDVFATDCAGFVGCCTVAGWVVAAGCVVFVADC